MQYFIDMDGVLVDVLDGICARWGVPRLALEDRMKELRCWDVIPAIKAQLKKQHPDWPKEESFEHGLGYGSWGEEEFWSRMQDEGFWGNLPPTKWMGRLLRHVDEISGGNWYIASTPRDGCQFSYAGKVRWVKRYLRNHTKRLILIEDKELLAGRDKVLIDDKPENIDKWDAAGGFGLLFPAANNEKRDMCRQPLEHVLPLLQTWKNLTSPSPPPSHWGRSSRVEEDQGP